MFSSSLKQNRKKVQKSSEENENEKKQYRTKKTRGESKN